MKKLLRFCHKPDSGSRDYLSANAENDVVALQRFNLDNHIMTRRTDAGELHQPSTGIINLAHLRLQVFLHRPRRSSEESALANLAGNYEDN